MLKIKSLTDSSIILQSLIDKANKDKLGRGKNDGNKTRILLLFFVFKKSNRVGFLTSGAKKAFILLWQAFIQVLIF